MKRVPRYLKYLPLLAIFAFGVVLISMSKQSSEASIGSPPTLSLTLGPTTVVTASWMDDSPAGPAVLTASPAIGSFSGASLIAGSTGEVPTASGASVTIPDDSDTVSQSKTVQATFQCLTPGVATFTLSQGGGTTAPSVQLFCSGTNIPGNPIYPSYPGAGYPYTQYPYGTTTYPTYGTTSAVTVSASPSSTTCTSPSSISVTVKDAAGNMAPNGTSVTVSASTGTVSPNVVSTSGGYATTSFMAPDNSNGTATVTATSGVGTGYATVAFTCTGVAAPAASTAPVYPQAVQYPQAQGPYTILPPNTGDAGLASGAQTSSGAGLALVALSVVGLSAGAWTWRKQRQES